MEQNSLTMMEDVDRLWFIQTRKTPESDTVDTLDEINQRIIGVRNRREKFVKNDRPEFLAPFIANEVWELAQVFILPESECPHEKMKADSEFAERVRNEFADILIFYFGFSNLLKINISKEIYSLLQQKEVSSKDSDTDFSTLKETVSRYTYDPKFDIPSNLIAQLGEASSRLFRPISDLKIELEEQKSNKTVAQGIIENEKLYKEIRKTFAQVLILIVMFANLMEIDITKAIDEKLKLVEKKYAEDQ